MNPEMTPSKENKYNEADEVHDNFKYFVITDNTTYGPYSKKDAIEVAKLYIEDSYSKVYICEAIAKAVYVAKIVKI